MKYNIIWAELILPLLIVTAIFGIYTIVITMSMVTFSVQNIIVAGVLLVSAMVCGIIRGKSESIKKTMDTAISEKKNDLTKFDSFSTTYLYDALYVLDIEYKDVGKQSVRKVFFENLPRFLKEALYVILVWGLVNTMASGELYSETYLILTAYGTILGIAEEVGKIAEKGIEIFQMRKNVDVKAVDEFERKENSLLEMNRMWVNLSEDGLTVSPLFTLDVKSASGEVKHYKLSRAVTINKGEHAILLGAKEVGKTRFLTFIESLFPNSVMIYNDNSKIFNRFYDNFKTEHGLDGDLVRELARGLKLERFANISDEEFKKLQITNINTGDKHLCVALVMLYFAVKAPETARIIVLDELLANVDEANSKEILSFIMSKVNEIGSSVIFVGHSQQELIKAYCHSQIKLCGSADAIKITQTVL